MQAGRGGEYDDIGVGTPDQFLDRGEGRRAGFTLRGFACVKSDVANAYQKVGDALREAGRWDEALSAYREALDRKSTRLNSSHLRLSRMPSSA